MVHAHAHMQYNHSHIFDYIELDKIDQSYKLPPP